MLFGTITFAKLLDLVAALSGGLGGLVETAEGGDGDGDFLPLRGLELAALERVPLLLVCPD